MWAGMIKQSRKSSAAKTANNLGIDTSTGSTGDPYDIAVAESINGLYKAEVIHRKSGENRTEVELVTLT